MRVAFDIDDTLWEVIRDKAGKPTRQVPDYDLVNVLRWFFKNGDEVYVWSAGGMDYAQTIVDKLGLSEMVKVIPKGIYGEPQSGVTMDVSFDDEAVKLAKVNVQVTRKQYEMDS